MIIDYDRNPNLNTEQKLQSLIESVQMALDELASRCVEIEKQSSIDPAVTTLATEIGWTQD